MENLSSSGGIEFYHAERDLTSRGQIQADGAFVLGTFRDQDGAPAGKHKVVVTQTILPGIAGATPREHGRHVATQYANFDSSEIEVEVKPEPNEGVEILVDGRTP